jgi:dTDP-4-amino-4,6-dideoxygalactose transaminase
MNFIDLKRQYAEIEKQINDGIHAVLEHGRYVLGPEIIELEKQLAEFAGVKHCVACSSGTDALLMPLMAWGIGPGDAVFTTPFTFIATAEVIKLAGATPVFVDIDERTYNIDPDKLDEAIGKVKSEGNLIPKLIIPVDLFGLPADFSAIIPIAEKHGLKILEDAAQGFGGEINGRKSGSWGDAAATSFFPAKPLGCYGDGGAVFTNDSELDKLLRSIRMHGEGEERYDNVRIGINGRLDSIQAAVLLAKMEIFDKEIKMRNDVADKYINALDGKVVTPYIPTDHTSCWAQFCVLAENEEHRSELQAKLKEKDIPTAIYYPKPLHLQDAFADLGYKKGDFPVTDKIAGRIFALPMHPYLTDEEINLIAETIGG